MEIKLYKPQNALLNEFVECFYTLKRTPTERSETYISFPSIYAMICLNASASIKVSGDDLTLSHVPKKAVETNLLVNFDSPGLVCYEGAADEIVIYLKPLGLNAFLEKNLRHYVQDSFSYFAPFEDYRKTMAEIFALPEDRERISTLENYWLSKLKNFRHPFLSSVIDDIINEKTSVSVTELVRRYGISRTTLNKQFDRHVCTTPSQFKKVVRFRKALEQYRAKLRAPNLSSVSHEAEYFDQSHMIKDFKSLTSFAPKSFFAKISELEEGKIVWLFL